MRHKPVVKLSRSLDLPLTEKAARIMKQRPYPPGDHGRRPRRQMGPYKERLLEKQRLRFQYHVSEKQLRRYFERASRRPEQTGEVLLQELETRLDAVILRSGFAKTVYQARQFVVHGHVHVDGKRVDRPAYRVEAGQKVSIAPKSKVKAPFERAQALPEAVNPPSYLQVNLNDLEVTLDHLPSRAQIPVICNEQLVVEYYAR